MTSRPIRTRIAPSPTGFLHLGTARTALFCWAFARHFGGEFILRIEDTDTARSTTEAAQQIIAAMDWLQLDYNEGPYFQMQRLDRYREVIHQMLQAGTAYRCYCTAAELEEMREGQRARGEKPRYDGRWRPEPGKVLPAAPSQQACVIRFRNPLEGEVSWTDMVKGPITIHNRELDDLVIARPQDSSALSASSDIGTPTYNFCVVVDDHDMQISHVIRGDDHVNNTPRQINILRALGAQLPIYGHVPMILGPDGEKLSKRHGAVSVTQYQEAGYLPQAMLNYLARLGWSHGDTEIFTVEQLVGWFDGTHLAKSPAQWDQAKLDWVNAQHIKALADDALAQALLPYLPKVAGSSSALPAMCGLYKDRCATLVELAQWVGMYFVPVQPAAADIALHVTEAVIPALHSLQSKLSQSTWDRASISVAIKDTLVEHGLKMPQLAHAVRVIICGRPQTPALDAVLALFPQEVALQRLQEGTK